MNEQPQFTPEQIAAVEAELEQSGAGGQDMFDRQEQPRDQQGRFQQRNDQSDDEPEDPAEGKLKWAQKVIGDQANTIGDLRKRLEALEAGAKQQAEPHEPEWSPEREEEDFNRWASVADPDWKNNKEISGYYNTMKSAYRMTQLAMRASANMVQNAVNEMQAYIGPHLEKQALAEAGVPVDFQAKMTNNPTLGKVWQGLSAEEKIGMYREMTGSNGAESGSGPAGSGSPARQRVVRSQFVEGSAGGTSAPSGMSNAPSAAQRKIMQGGPDLSKDPEVKSYIDGILDEQLNGVPGALIIPSNRGRG